MFLQSSTTLPPVIYLSWVTKNQHGLTITTATRSSHSRKHFLWKLCRKPPFSQLENIKQSTYPKIVINALLAFVNVCEALISHRNMLSIAKVLSKEDKCNSSVINNRKMLLRWSGFSELPFGRQIKNSARIKWLLYSACFWNVCEHFLNLPFHPNSSVQEISSRLPDVDFSRLQDLVRKMARANEIKSLGGRKYRKYLL